MMSQHDIACEKVMMPKQLRTLAVFTAWILTFCQISSCTSVDDGGDEPPSQNICLPSDLNPTADLPMHIKYVSMVGEEFPLSAQYDSRWIADTQKLAQFGNVITLGVKQATPDELQNLENKLSLVKTLRKKAAVHIQNIFVDRERTALHTDYENNWSQILPVLGKYQDVIIALYLWDEPFWAAESTNVSPASVYDSLVLQNRLVKQTLPGIPTAIVEGYPVINETLRIPPGIDWVGMDCYGDFQSCGDARYGEMRAIPEYYEILKSKMTPHQKLIAVPTGIVDGNYATDQVPLDKKLHIVNVADDFFRWASTEDRMVGLFTFIYHSTAEYTAVENMCEVEEYYRRAAERFLAAGERVSPSQTPLNVLVTAQTEERDFTLQTSPSVEITSNSAVTINFKVSGGAADLYGVQCDISDLAGTIVECAGRLDSGLTIPANRVGTYKIKVSRGTESVITNFSISADTNAE
ncbi:MAG: hypothetical protein V4628_17935 [Pseudomonadota bacterium]